MDKESKKMDEYFKDDIKNYLNGICCAIRELGFNQGVGRDPSTEAVPGTTEKIAMELADINESLKSIALSLKKEKY